MWLVVVTTDIYCCYAIRERVMKWMFFCSIILPCISCAPRFLSTEVPRYPAYPLPDTTTRLVVANACDVSGKSMRLKKEEFFRNLTNEASALTSEKITSYTGIPARFEEGWAVPENQPDSSVQKLLKRNDATHAILINFFKAYFDKTNVETYDNDGVKTREAFYDIVVEIGYSLRSLSGLRLDTLIRVRKFHGSRAVLIGLLAFGPNVVANKEEAAEGVLANVEMYMKCFYPGWELRTRRLILTNGFRDVRLAINAYDYELAFQKATEKADSPNSETAALANYNCAVIAEYLGDYEKAWKHLRNAKSGYVIPEVNEMMKDYRNFPVLPLKK
jgi:hypothetical protein